LLISIATPKPNDAQLLLAGDLVCRSCQRKLHAARRPKRVLRRATQRTAAALPGEKHTPGLLAGVRTGMVGKAVPGRVQEGGAAVCGPGLHRQDLDEVSNPTPLFSYLKESDEIDRLDQAA